MSNKRIINPGHLIGEHLLVFSESNASAFFDLILNDKKRKKYFCIALELKTKNELSNYYIFNSTEPAQYLGLNITSRDELTRFINKLYIQFTSGLDA